MPPDSIRGATAQLRDDLDPYLELLDEREVIKFTGSWDDGVIASELWAWVKILREETGYKIRSAAREKDALASVLQRRGAKLVTDTAARFKWKAYWRGCAGPSMYSRATALRCQTGSRNRLASDTATRNFGGWPPSPSSAA